ncbi:MAG: ABC transporter ATP-binding protein [Thermodesulfobacteriota bacterium]|nr:ABC transporter ATP-binding protein [Thermodesulfobacteriota bacterium]
MISKLITPYFVENKGKIALGIFFLIVVDFFQIIIPWIVKSAVNALSLEELDMGLILKFSGAIVFSGLCIAVLRYFWRMLLMGTAKIMEKGLRDHLFSHILKLDARCYDRVRTGDLMAHATSDINHIRLAFGMGMIALTDAFFLGGATIAFMLYMNVKLTLLALIPMPFLILTAKTLGRKMHNYHSKAQEAYSSLTEMVRESFYGIRILKVFNYERMISRKVEESSVNYFNKNFKRAVLTALIKPMMIFFLNLSMFIIVFYGGALVIRDLLSPGELVAFIQYMWLLAWPVIAVGWMINLVERGLSSLKRIEKVVETEPEVKHNPKASPVDTPLENIDFHDIVFSYDSVSSNNRLHNRVLDNISLSIRSKEFIGITGPPGSGKTSLVQLIPRLYDPDSGKLCFNGQDIKTRQLNTVREKTALMPQESFLFSGTIRDNIVMGRNISKRQMSEAVRYAMLETTIDHMPAGIDTIVGERGITLSGGQKQRIAFARTILEEKEVFVFDDPVSQLDTETASEIIKRLDDFKNQSTIVLVSHRIAALAFCDAIYVLKNGKIECSGNHDTLMTNNLFYKNAYTFQLSTGRN